MPKIIFSVLIPVLAIMLVVSVSGCINVADWTIPGFEPKPVTVKETDDILIVTDKQTIPLSPVVPNSDVELSFRIENQDTKKTIENVGTDVFDSCLLQKGAGGFSGEKMYPRAIRPVYIRLTTPTVEQIGNIKHICDVKFFVNYDFTGSTLYDLVVINMEEIKNAQQAGTETPLSVMTAQGSGPIKLDVSLLGVKQAVIAEQTAPVQVIVNNKGSGILKDNKILAGKLTIYFPAGMASKIDATKTAGEFTCSGMTCTNGKDIEIFQKESSPIIFYVTFSKAPMYYKTFTVRSQVDYTYQLREEVSVEVKPFAS